MNIFFDPIESKYIKKFFPGFFYKEALFFEIIVNFEAIGFYAIESITEKVCEISVYCNEKFRPKISKEIVLKCLRFPFMLGFEKTLLRTELKSVYKLFCKMTKYGVNYLFKQKNTHWFEVTYGP